MEVSMGPCESETTNYAFRTSSMLQLYSLLKKKSSEYPFLHWSEVADFILLLQSQFKNIYLALFTSLPTWHLKKEKGDHPEPPSLLKGWVHFLEI